MEANVDRKDLKTDTHEVNTHETAVDAVTNEALADTSAPPLVIEKMYATDVMKCYNKSNCGTDGRKWDSKNMALTILNEMIEKVTEANTSSTRSDDNDKMSKIILDEIIAKIILQNSSRFLEFNNDDQTNDATDSRNIEVCDIKSPESHIVAKQDNTVNNMSFSARNSEENNDNTPAVVIKTPQKTEQECFCLTAEEKSYLLTTPTRNPEKASLSSQIQRLRRDVTQKRETLRKLRQARMYKTKENAELDGLTKKWRNASQNVVLELADRSEQTPKPTIAALLQYYNIDYKQIQYDRTKDAFYK